MDIKRNKERLDLIKERYIALFGCKSGDFFLDLSDDEERNEQDIAGGQYKRKKSKIRETCLTDRVPTPYELRLVMRGMRARML